MTNKGFKTKPVKVVGKLHAGRSFFLLNPYPITSDSWEGDDTRRWVGVPDKIVDVLPSGRNLYSHARHIVSNNFTVEYFDPDELEIVIMLKE